MRFDPVSYEELGFSKLFREYVAGNTEAPIHGFFGGNPFDANSFIKAAASRTENLNRQECSDALLAFNARFNPPGKVIQNILDLKKPGTWTITAGQQPGLFGGPVYCLLKAVSVIATARYLTKETDLNVVPVFWMADEDHDFEEIRSANIPDLKHGNGSLRSLSFPGRTKAQFATGDLLLDDTVNDLVDHALRLAGNGNGPARELKRLLKHWSPGRPWVEAFGSMMQDVFGEYGLILAGSRHPDVKQAAAPLLDRILRSPDDINSLLKSQTDLLGKTYPAQVQLTDSQLFWHHERDGRIKMPWSGGRWVLPLDTPMELKPDSAASYISQHDLYDCLSPNVFIRPLLQQYLLPNLAYFGGAAEIAYHAQMKPLFTFFGLQMPLMLPRLSATFCEPHIREAMTNFEFSFTDYKNSDAHLHRTWAESENGYDLDTLFENWKGEMEALAKAKRTHFDGLEASLDTSLKSTTVRMQNELESLRDKVVRAVKKKEAVQMARLSRIQASLFPDGVLQERTLAWTWVAAKYGPSLIQMLTEQAETSPFDYLKAHQIIYL